MSASQKRPSDAKLAFQIHQTRPSFHTRNPFESPNFSAHSVSETDDGSTSGQSEFHLERYSNSVKYKHVRQVSKASTNTSDRNGKLGLSIVTDFSSPKISVASNSVTINQVPAKQVQPGRNWTTSIVSQRGVHATTTPKDEDLVQPQNPSSRVRREKSTNKRLKRTTYINQLRHVVKQQAQNPSSASQGSTGVSKSTRDGVYVHQGTVDPSTTPQTPAILVTPAGERVPWVLQVPGGEHSHRPASSIYSAMPTSRMPAAAQFNVFHNPAAITHPSQNSLPNESMSRDSPNITELNTSTTSGSGRSQLQGWWDVILSPLMRNGSQASKASRNIQHNSPVPPMPISAITKETSSAISDQSSPSILVSRLEASPETPRRAGLATARASTWSRWTEWEEEREANQQQTIHDDLEVGNHGQDCEDKDDAQVIPTPIPAVNKSKVGLATEYYHACAIEELTGEPYFECINHSCAEKLPKFASVYDQVETRAIVLGSPFEDRRKLSGCEIPIQDLLKSPSVLEDSQSPLSPYDLSPNVRQASIAAVVKARSFESLGDKKNSNKAQRSSETSTDGEHDEKALLRRAINETPEPCRGSSTKSEDEKKPLTVVCGVEPTEEVVTEKKIPLPQFEEVSEKSKATITSPGPISPDGQNTLHPSKGVPMTDLQFSRNPPIVINNYTNPQSLPERPAFITAETSYPELPQRAPTATVTADDLQTVDRTKSESEKRRRRLEKEDAVAKKVGGLWRGRGCFSSSGCMGRGGPENRAKRRWVIAISVLLLIVIIVSVVLATTLTRREDTTPVNGQWLNLTGFPPMPTGVLTIATPNLVFQQSQCMVVSTFWSCSVPKEDQNQLNGDAPSQPNFRFEIKFRNGTVPANLTVPISSNTKTSPKTSTDPFTNDLFISNPNPPNSADQLFLGNTTDNITVPFDGEQTPFYLTLLPTFPIIPSAFNSSTSKKSLSGQHERRQNSNSTFSSGNPSAIPAPAVLTNGTAAPANLLPTSPFPVNQPLRLYNRGLQDEHYGFYIYYDKSIYISALVLNGTTYTGPPVQPIDADRNGGSTKSLSNSRCTFSQTRFLVKFYTNPNFNGNLLATPLPLGSGIDTNNSKTKNNETLSSAINFNRPGSFPYPTSIILDRHGGNIDNKGVYCYGMDAGQIVKENRIVLGENINFGGVVINHPTFDGFNKTAGGIDGGTGGCGCQWQNWQ